MYQELYDENHKLNKFRPDDLAQGKDRVQRPSTGEYEGEILCERCDGRIIGGNYEDYAAKAMYGGRLPIDELPDGTTYITEVGFKFTRIENISYMKYKLFLLSVLWRASISSRRVFQSVSLGPHEEKLRQMIYNGNPGQVDEYPIMFYSYRNVESLPNDFIASPTRSKNPSGHNIYVLPISGMLYKIFVNSRGHKIPNYVIEHTLNPNNKMDILHIPKGKGKDILSKYLHI